IGAVREVQPSILHRLSDHGQVDPVVPEELDDPHPVHVRELESLRRIGSEQAEQEPVAQLRDRLPGAARQLVDRELAHVPAGVRPRRLAAPDAAYTSTLRAVNGTSPPRLRTPLRARTS